MAVEVETEPTFKFGKSKILFNPKDKQAAEDNAVSRAPQINCYIVADMANDRSFQSWLTPPTEVRTFHLKIDWNFPSGRSISRI